MSEDEKRQRALVEVDDFISKKLSDFLGYLRDLTLTKHPVATKSYVQEVIDITLERAADWTWSDSMSDKRLFNIENEKDTELLHEVIEAVMLGNYSDEEIIKRLQGIYESSCWFSVISFTEQVIYG